jgi:glycosyltransferase involved in cell wall biosynthesis
VRLVSDLAGHLDTPDVDYDVVVVSRPHNVERVRRIIAEELPHAKVIYDAEALFYRRIEMRSDLVTADARPTLEREAAEMKALEADAVAWAECVVCISEAEASFAKELGARRVEVVGPLLEATKLTEATFSERRDIGFVAGWAAGPESPNCDALLWFAKEVLPRVRSSVPSARLLVTGVNPPPAVTWLSGAGVEFVGSVPDLYDFYDTIRVAISPARFGAGVKLKTVEAIQYGVPVVCTAEGAAGIPGSLEDAVWITDRAENFAGALVDLITEEPTWDRYRRACASHRDDEALGDQGVARWPSIVRSVLAAPERLTRQG